MYKNKIATDPIFIKTMKVCQSVENIEQFITSLNYIKLARKRFYKKFKCGHPLRDIKTEREIFDIFYNMFKETRNEYIQNYIKVHGVPDVVRVM